jgi:hypothetical protein
VAAIVSGASTWPAAAQVPDAEPAAFVLIDRELHVTPARDPVIQPRAIHFRDESGYAQRWDIESCLAVIAEGTAPSIPPAGAVVLADGQRLPGVLGDVAPREDGAIVWLHAWLDRMTVPLERVATAVFQPDAAAPAPGVLDVILLSNGDRLEGLLAGIGANVSLDVERDGRRETTLIPFERVAAVTLVAPPRPPTGTRVWFRDGTVLAVERILAGDDGYVRLVAPLAPRVQEIQLRIADVLGITFDPDAIVPLAALPPARVEDNPLRFEVPAPCAMDAGAPLGLSRIELRGPLVVRYALPPGARRFAARGAIPRDAQAWADFELIVSCDAQTLVRTKLGAGAHEIDVNIPVRGAELTIEITEGGNGPIQDRLVLERAMFLVE